MKMKLRGIALLCALLLALSAVACKQPVKTEDETDPAVTETETEQPLETESPPETADLVETAKTEAAAQLRGYVNTADYQGGQKALVEAAIAAGLDAIDAAQSVEAVKAALTAAAEEDVALIDVSAAETGTRIVAKGKSGHAAFPAGADNAIARLTRVLTAADLLTGTAKSAVAALADLTTDAYGKSEGVAFSDEPSGELTLVYGVAHLKDGLLTVSVDSRYPVTMDGAKLEADLRTVWAKLGFTVKEFDLSEPFYIPVDDPRVTALMSLYKDVTGRDDPPYAMGGGTYSRAVPGAISFGPGMPGVKHDYSAFLPEGHGGAHGRDEVLPIDKMLTCSKIYVAALAELDGVIE